MKKIRSFPNVEKALWEKEQEGHDGPVLVHWLICKVPSYQTLQYLGTGLKHKAPETDLGSITYQCNRLQLQLLINFMITDYIMITQIFKVINYNYNYFCIVIMITL